MKNSKVLIVIVGVFLLLAVGGWLVTRRGTTSPVVSSNSNGDMVEVKTQDAATSIAEIMGRGGNVKCTYQADGADFGSSDTTLYISGKKMRMDSSVTDEDGKNRLSSTISDGDFVYVWSDQETTGIKIAADKTTDQSADQWQGQAQYVDPNQKVDYKCEAWMADDTKFTPPSTITFTDFGAIQQTQCDMCDALTGEQKQTCLTSLNCN